MNVITGIAALSVIGTVLPLNVNFGENTRLVIAKRLFSGAANRRNQANDS
jgi:hypothetical protein